MASTSIRTAVARRVIELLQADGDLAGVTVTYGFPRDGVTGVGEPIVFVQVAEDGGTTTTHMKAGRKSRTDEWDVEVWVAMTTAADDENGLVAAERVEAVFASVENLCAANPTLQQDGSTVDGLIWAVVDGDSDGPRVTPIDSGYLAWWNARIACRARLD